MQNKIDFTPIGDRVIFEIEPCDEKTKGGLFVPETARKKVRTGRVIAVGKGITTKNGVVVPTTVLPDQIIIFYWNSTQEVMYGGIKYLITKESDILGILE